MNKRAITCVAIGYLAMIGGLANAADWPQFRGRASNSAVPQEKLAIDWSQPKPFAWKSPLPGRGPSSPIVVGDRVFVTASSGGNQDRLHVLCFDAATGKQLWQRQFWATGRTVTHPSSANAAPTPASDGKRVFAFYSSNDLAALDLDGNLLWYRGLALDYPRAGNDVGMGSSPAVIGDTVVAQVENQGNSFAIGIDTATGKTKWHIPRAAEASWTSPIVLRGKTNSEDVLLLQSINRLSAHDPATGRELWSYKAACEGIPSAAALDGIVYVPSEGLTALDGKSGSVSPPVVWKQNTLLPGAASPLVSGERIYLINRSGVLNCADAKTGEVLWKLRLDGAFWSTPTLAGDQLICVSESGVAQVIALPSDGSVGKAIAKTDLGEPIQSSPAVVDGAVYLRGDHNLYKFGGIAK